MKTEADMNNKFILGIEFGSTRIKAVLIDDNAAPVAEGSHKWTNKLVDGMWSYSLEDIANGVRDSYARLAEDYERKYGEPLTEVAAMGVSAMMHGYMAFDKDGNLLVPFRTWRNTCTERASNELSELFNFHIPQRWTVAHFYEAILKNEPHVPYVEHIFTLECYVHYMLTGERVTGIGEASGILPVKGNSYDPDMMSKFNALIKEKGVNKDFEVLIPRPLVAGECAGYLTEEGARWLDPTGRLKAGCMLCPPEGDADTGMVATNCVSAGSASVSAGTSAFVIIGLEKPLTRYYHEIDVLVSPTGVPMAMVQVNNFCSEIDLWAGMFNEVLKLGGSQMTVGELFEALYESTTTADHDCGGLIGYNFLSGEHLVNVERGVPLIARSPEGKLTLANFMKMQIYSALGSLAIGMEIFDKENVRIRNVYGHGGFFKSGYVPQSAMSAALGAPVTVMENAGEGGAWGIAVLALYALCGKGSFEDFLNSLFADSKKSTVEASETEKADFKAFKERYRSAMGIEKLASKLI